MEFLPLLGIAVVIAGSVPLSIIDFREHRLPNRFTYPAIAINLALVAIAGIATLDPLRTAISLAVAAATWGIGYALSNAKGIGMGDVKLLVAINASVSWFSPVAVLVLLAIGFSLASIASLVLILMRKANLKTPIAMGPFLLLGLGYVAVEIIQQVFTEVVGS